MIKFSIPFLFIFGISHAVGQELYTKGETKKADFKHIPFFQASVSTDTVVLKDFYSYN